MAAANNTKIRFTTQTDDGKTGSQTFGDVAGSATDENISAVLDLLSWMQVNSVTGKQKIVTSDLV